MHHTLPSIDFSSIRPLRGKQTDGFEELSVQLFYGETESKGEFFAIEGSGGDGGVEAYRERETGEKIGLQSKYWSELGDTQWRQLTKSVETALKNHPELRIYIITTPLDRSPAQTAKWKALVKAWNEYAKSIGITHSIKFDWWGYTELLGLLSHSRYRNLLVYWLGLPEFSQDWLNAINRSNIELLGKRYSPKQHIETDSGRRLEAYSWGEHSKMLILSIFTKIAEHWQKIDRSEIAKANTDPGAKDLTRDFRKIMRAVASFRWPQSGYPPIRPFHKTCSEALDKCNELEWKLRELNFAEKEKMEKERRGKSTYQSPPYEYLIHDLRRLADIIAELKQATDLSLAADESKIILLGEAGSGKSHLIADLVNSATNRSQPALLLLGERYLSSNDPWSSTIESLGWGHSADDLLAALDQEGRLAGRPALLCIDALNESEHRRLWQSHLIDFAARVANYHNVKLLVSCRSDFVQITLPEAVHLGTEMSWQSIEHQGYGAEVIEAIEVYFSEFNIRAPYFPPALEEFRNPLFLRVFCEAFAGQELPTGPLSLDHVMRARIDRLCAQILKEIDCDPEDTRAALKAIAREIARNGGRSIPRINARALAAEHFQNPDTSTSLYGRLLSNGMLVETVRYTHNPSIHSENVTVRFPFERFSDYFIGLQILDGIENTTDFSTLFNEGGRLNHLRDFENYYDNRGIARALAILAPERLGIEFAETFSGSTVRKLVLEDFLESLAWRSANSFTASSESILDEAEKAGLNLLPAFIKISTIPQHPFNSEFLGVRLANLGMPDREWAWTIPVAEMSASSDDTILEAFIDWSFRAPIHLIPDEQALLASRLLLWFCTSNYRALRKRATIASIRLLVGRPHLVRILINELHSVDDPYLVERLYAVAAGVALRLPPCESLSELASDVYTVIFKNDPITPNILVRDFASRVLEVCLVKGCLPEEISPTSFRPPFKTSWPEIPTDEMVMNFDSDIKNSDIVSSLRCDMDYGDFGRYTVGAEVSHFSTNQLTGPPPDDNNHDHFPTNSARKWITMRILELGWSSELFGTYDAYCPVGRKSSQHEQLKLERIGKKYQWIALHEFIGYLADHFWMNRFWNGDKIEFMGAWQLYSREFDPTQKLEDLDKIDINNSQKPDASWGNYPDPFSDIQLCNNRLEWVSKSPDDFTSLLANSQNADSINNLWLTLAGFREWKEPSYERIIHDRKGELRMWVSIRSFLVKNDDFNKFVNLASKKNFYGHGIEFPAGSNGWLGEYPWERVFEDLSYYCESPDRRLGEIDAPYTHCACYWDNGSNLVPSPQLCELLQIYWSGENYDFYNRIGDKVTSHLGMESSQWSQPLIIKRSEMLDALKTNKMSLVWCIVAEKSCFCYDTMKHITGIEQEISAIYWLENGLIKGGQTQNINRNLRSS